MVRKLPQVTYDQWGNEYPAEWLSYNGIKPWGPDSKLIRTHFIVDGKIIVKKQIIVHTFTVGDVEDPDLYAAEPMFEWQKSEAGEWVMENCCDGVPSWSRYIDPTTYGHKYMISAVFEEKKLTEFYLRFGNSAQKRVPL